jgi:hypothetical protein
MDSVMSNMLLAVDFPGVDDRARVSDLADVLPNLTVRQLMAGPLPPRGDAGSFAEALLARSASPTLDPVVVGYCMATPIAHEVAVQCAADTLVLLDGSPCPAQFVEDSYQVLLNRFAERAVQPSVTFGEEELATRPEDLLARMGLEVTDVLGNALSAHDDRNNLISRIIDDLVQRAVYWMGHLIASYNAPFTPWPGRAVLITSRDAGFSGPWPGAQVTTTVSVDCSRAELIAHPSTRQALRECLSWSRALGGNGRP